MGQRLQQAPDAELCLAEHVWAYLAVTALIRPTNALFVTTVPSHEAAAQDTLWQWFAAVLPEGGCDGVSKLVLCDRGLNVIS